MTLKVEKKSPRGSRRRRRKPSLRRHLKKKKPKARKKLPKEGGAATLGAGEDGAARAWSRRASAAAALDLGVDGLRRRQWCGSCRDLIAAPLRSEDGRWSVTIVDGGARRTMIAVWRALGAMLGEDSGAATRGPRFKGERVDYALLIPKSSKLVVGEGGSVLDNRALQIFTKDVFQLQVSAHSKFAREVNDTDGDFAVEDFHPTHCKKHGFD
ncbi:hypothetical protein U1Q18_000880 [Sarracenia purpurea var. burkii]